MNAGKENGADGDPQESGQPTPDNRNGRSDNRRGTGNRGEVMPPQNELVGGNKIDAVFKLMSRRFEFVIQFENDFGEKTGVNEITRSHRSQSDNQQQYCAHHSFLKSWLVCCARVLLKIGQSELPCSALGPQNSMDLRLMANIGIDVAQAPVLWSNCCHNNGRRQFRRFETSSFRVRACARRPQIPQHGFCLWL